MPSPIQRGGARPRNSESGPRCGPPDLFHAHIPFIRGCADLEQLIQLHVVQLLDVSIPFGIDVALGHPLGAHRRRITVDVGRQGRQLLEFLRAVHDVRERRRHVFAAELVDLQLQAVAGLRIEHDVLLEGRAHVLRSEVADRLLPVPGVGASAAGRVHQGVRAVVVLLDDGADRSPEVLDAGFVRVELVRPARGDLRLLAGGRNEQLVAVQAHADRNAGLIPLAVRSCERRNRDVLVLPFAEHGVRSPLVGEADDRRVRVLLLGRGHGGVLREHLLVDEARFIQLVGPLQPFLVFLCHRIIDRLAVLDEHVVAVRIGDAERIEEVHAQPFLGIRNLVVLAVSVRILLLERLEHVVEIVDRIRHLEAELIQPRLVDDRLELRFRTGRQPCRHGVDFAVRERAQLFQLRRFLQRGLQVRHVGIDVFVQWAEVAQIVDDVGVREREIAENDVRQRAAGEHDRLLLVPVVGGHDLPFDPHIRIFLQIDHPLVLGERVAHVAPADGQRLERYRRLDDRQAFLVELAGLHGCGLVSSAAAAGGQPDQQSSGEQRGHHGFRCGTVTHLSFPPINCCREIT
ncbi:hypothetical protein BN871_AC_00640 [Paenibacillus sp. P22]|nr:hypothetical protein BN871_AC_00640 [Paenibacillus sp. P22]